MNKRWRLAAVVLAIGIVGWLSPTRADTNTGLVAYYPFNGDANDASGNGNNGTVIGASFTNFTNGGGAAQFAGNSSSYVLVPRSASLEPTNGLSISMWCNGVPGQACGSGYGTILRKEGACTAGYAIRGCNSGPVFTIFPPDPCGLQTALTAAFPPFTADNWVHIVGTYSVADEMIKSYVNGVLVNQTPCSYPLIHSGDLNIGGANVDYGDGGFDGLINEVRIYNRALSASDVAELYTNGVLASGCTGCTGPQGPPGVGVVSGEYIMLPTNSVAPAGYTFLGTTVLKYKPDGSEQKKTAALTLNIYQRN